MAFYGNPMTFDPYNPPIPVAGRQCGDCAMCCKLGSIKEVNKPDGQWCQHCSTRKGCDIYETRPEVCRTYYCYYMLSTLNEDWRPTTCKFMVSIMQGNLVYVTVDPSRPDAWKKEPYYSSIRNWATKKRVVVLIGLQALAVYPDRTDDLGRLEDGYFLTAVNEQTPTGIVQRTVRVHKDNLPAGVSA